MCLLSRTLPCTAVLALASSSGALHAQTTWYVDDDAIAPGLGTPGAPYSSIQFAIDSPSTIQGDTILVAAGTYVERIDLGEPITVRAIAGPTRTILVKPAGPGAALVTTAFLDPDQASTLRLIGFTLTGMVGSGRAVNLRGGTLDHCIVAGNDALGVSSINGVLKHCTVADNGTGVFFATFGDTRLEDSIVWGNGTDIEGVGGFGTARYTTFGTNPGGFMASAGPGNESADPLFRDAEAGDFRLSPDSSCIDTADPGWPPDFDGSPADRGALPFRPRFKLRAR
jgi:hypothetical protein